MTGKTLRDKKSGRFAGSIGEGKTRVPSSATKSKNIDLLSPTFDSSTDTALGLIDPRVFSKDSGARYAAAAVEPIDPLVAEKLFNDRDIDVIERLIDNPTLPVELYTRLADHPVAEIRATVINHDLTKPSKISSDKLVKLSYDTDIFVRAAVANNLFTPNDVLGRLSDEVDENIQVGLAQNSRISSNVIAKLVRSPHLKVRAHIARKAFLEIPVLDALISDRNDTIREVLANNRSIPLYVFDKLSRDPSFMVRAALVNNPKISTELLQQIVLLEPDFKVKSIAEANLKQRLGN